MVSPNQERECVLNLQMQLLNIDWMHILPVYIDEDAFNQCEDHCSQCLDHKSV